MSFWDLFWVSGDYCCSHVCQTTCSGDFGYPTIITAGITTLIILLVVYQLKKFGEASTDKKDDTVQQKGLSDGTIVSGLKSTLPAVASTNEDNISVVAPKNKKR